MSVTAEDIVVGEVVPYTGPAAVEEYRPRIVMAPEEAKALDDQLRANMRAVLHEDSDYGVIPGTKGKPTLLKPGAEKLLQWFGFGHTMERAEIERDEDGRRLGVTYRCTVTKGLPEGRTVVIAMCEGYAGYDEDRFYTSAEDAEAKERANADRYKRSPNPAKFAEYRAPWNSVIKMSQKRAMVGAALQATSASSLFTQDMEDVVQTARGDFAEQARAAIKALPQWVGAELDAWYKALNWPDPGEWNAEQWVKALIKTGMINGTGGEATRRAASPATPAREAAQEAPQPSGEDDQWTEQAFIDAGEYATSDDGRKLWAEIEARHAEGRMTDDDKNRLSRAIQDRLRELRQEAA